MSHFSAQVDIRYCESSDKNDAIFETFNNLAKGEKLKLVNDYDPSSLYYQFADRYGSQFEWEYLEQGPQVWRVSIMKK